MTSNLRSAGQAVAAVALTAVVVWGAYVRFSQLWVGDLSLEELNHYYVGRALVEQHQPVLPSGVWYSRGIEYSRLTEWTNRFIASPEIAVRLPSTVFGCLALVVVAVGTWALAGPLAAVAATLLFAVYPEAVIQARTGRRDSVQLFFGLIALFAGWWVVRGPPARDRRELMRAWKAALVVGLALAVAVRMQVTTLPTVLAWWIFLVGVGAVHLRSEGREAWRWSAPVQMAWLMAGLGLTALIAYPTLVIPLTLRAISTPYWARVSQHDPLLYYQSLAIWFPPIALIGALSFAYLLVRERRLGAYLLTMFGIPAVVFFLLPFRAPRFMLIAVPPLLIAIGVAVGHAAAALMRSSAAARMREPGRRRWVQLAALGLLLLVPIVTAGPALGMAAFGYQRIQTPGWTEAGSVLASQAELAGVPVGATRSLPALFYWGHVDFSVSVGHLEQWGTAQGGAEEDLLSGAYMMSVPGTPEMYAGVPVFPTPETVREHYADVGSVVIAIDDTSLSNQMVDERLLDTLRREGRELCTGRCGSLRLYYWRFSE
jgi:hypothetical protein